MNWTAETRRWVEEGVISNHQRQSIRERLRRLERRAARDSTLGAGAALLAGPAAVLVASTAQAWVPAPVGAELALAMEALAAALVALGGVARTAGAREPGLALMAWGLGCASAGGQVGIPMAAIAGLPGALGPLASIALVAPAATGAILALVDRSAALGVVASMCAASAFAHGLGGLAPSSPELAAGGTLAVLALLAAGTWVEGLRGRGLAAHLVGWGLLLAWQASAPLPGLSALPTPAALVLQQVGVAALLVGLAIAARSPALAPVVLLAAGRAVVAVSLWQPWMLLPFALLQLAWMVTAAAVALGAAALAALLRPRAKVEPQAAVTERFAWATIAEDAPTEHVAWREAPSARLVRAG